MIYLSPYTYRFLKQLGWDMRWYKETKKIPTGKGAK